MKLYLDGKEVDKNYLKYTLYQILSEVQTKLDDKIIKEIYLDKVQINEKYLKETPIDKENINEVKFITQKTDILIEETLNEIELYLPRLKRGCLDAVELFRNSKIDKANNKLQLIFSGLNWYTETTNKILDLLENKTFKEKHEYNLISLNEFLKELNEAQENEDNILVADILEYEIVEMIDKFIFLNNKVLNFLKGDSE